MEISNYLGVCVCVCVYDCAKTMFTLELAMWVLVHVNCLEWSPGLELDGFYFSPTNL